MRRTTAVLLTTALAAAGSLGFTPDPDYAPDFVTQEAFFHASTTPVGNLDAAALEEHVTWNEEAPTAPIPSAYGQANLAVLSPTVSDHDDDLWFTATGTFTGDLDTLAVDLYVEHAALNLCDLSLSFELVVDGVTLLSQDYTGSQGVGFESVSDTRGMARFELTNIYEAMLDYASFGFDIDPQAGPDVEREVTLNIQNFYLCNEFVALYDGADAPSSITANAYSFFHPDFDVLDMPPPVS